MPSMPDRLTEESVSFAAGLTFESLPGAVVHAAKRCLVDGVGVAVAGLETDVAAPLKTYVIEQSGPGPGKRHARLFGDPSISVQSSQAALYLGACGNALDWDDVQLPEGPGRPFGLLMHATVPLLATIAPVIDVVRSECGRVISGREALTAFVAGWEMAGKLATAINPQHYFKGFHTSGTIGTFGCAMAAAKLFELNEEQTTWAIGHAASMAAGVRASLGTMTKPLHVGWAAARGIEAALLARTGIDGSADALDGPWGFLTVAGSGAGAAGPGADVNLVTGRFGNPFVLADPGVSAKPYPCGSVTHPGMDALKRAMAEYELTADDIARIVVSAGSNVWGPISYPFATTAFEAKYSFPFLLAAIALTGGAGRAQFREDFIQSDACVAFQKKVEIRHDEVLDAMSTDVVHTRLDIDTRDGRTISIDARADYPGGPKVPMDDQGVNAKFSDATHGLLAPDRRETVRDLLWSFEQAADAGVLLETIGVVTVQAQDSPGDPAQP